MKKERKKRKGSVFTLLLTNYIVFTLALVVALSAVFVFLMMLTYNYAQDLTAWQMRQYSAALTAEEYSNFPTQRLLGDEGFIVVLDDKLHTVYSEGPIDVSLTTAELTCIPVFGGGASRTIRELHLPDGGINYEVSIGSKSLNDSSKDALYLLDENYHLLYASGQEITKDLTEKEYRLLTQTYYEGYHVNQFSFLGSSGKTFTLLLFEKGGELYAFGTRTLQTWADGGIIFLVIYCLMIAFFIFWMRRKIAKPLRLLGQSLNQFEVGTEIPDSYRGPREFREIFDSFSTMAQRLQRSEEERRTLESEKKAMLANITHDLKTPITVIQGYSKALNDGVIPESEQKQYLATIQKKADSLNQLINSFYEYNKLEHPEYQLTLERVDICNYLRDYVADRYSELDTAGFVPEADIPEEHIFCNIDQSQLRRVLDNIVGNATKHNPKGTILYFGLETRDDTAVITLADSGVGIAPEISDLIFAPFTVGEASRSGGGSGLGLSIAKRIVEMHGGKICLRSNIPPYSTIFELSLPL